MTLALTNATFIDRNATALSHGTIIVTPDGIAMTDEIPADAQRIDCTNRIVTPTFTIAHHHIYSALARGMPAPARVPKNFVEILELIWWNLDKSLDLEMVAASAQAVAIDAIRSGVGFIIDHHASPNAAVGSLHAIAEVLDHAGIGHLLCYELSDRDGEARRDAGLEETRAYLKAHPGLVGLHASFTVSDQLLDAALEIANSTGTGIHIHVAEDGADQDHCLAQHGCRVVERLHRASALQSTATILAHCIHLDDAERAMIADSNVWVSQQSESNQNNAVGALDARAFDDRVMIGTDGMHSDALAAARASYLMAQHEEGGMSPRDALDRLRRVHGYLEQNSNAESPGNLVILDYAPPTPVTAENWPGHMMYGLNRSHVESVILKGRLVMDRRKFVEIDEAQVLAHCREQAARLWERL